jgi:hypothetical protein
MKPACMEIGRWLIKERNAETKYISEHYPEN